MIQTRSCRPPILVTALGLCCAVSAAQGPVIVVDDDGGPGVDFTSLKTALESAPDGSTVLVRSGDYDSLIVRRSMTVQADSNAEVKVQTVIVTDMNDARGCVVRGFRTEGPISLQQSSGPIWLEDCSTVVPGFVYTPGAAQPAVRILSCPSVVLTRVDARVGPIVTCGLDCFFVHPGGTGLVVGTSNVHLFDCEIEGGPGVLSLLELSSPGGPGVEASAGSFVYAAGCRFRGGDGGEGVAVDASCTTLQKPPGPGAEGLRAPDPGAELRFLDTEVLGGREGSILDDFGGAPCGAQPGPLAPDMQVAPGNLTELPGTARGFVASSPARSGEVAALDFTGLPNDVVLLVLALAQDPTFEAALLGTLALAPPGRLLLLGVGPPSGLLHFNVDVPPLGVDSRVLFAQALALGADAVPQIGAPSVQVWLSAAF